MSLRRGIVVAASAALVVAHAREARADYAARGPEAFVTSDLAASSTGAIGGKLVVPNGAGPYPIVIASHGFSASSANQLGWAEHFASYGFVVAAPDFPGGLSPDHAKNAAIVEALVGEVARAVPKADPTRIGLEGHSAGGLATALAGAKIRPGAIVLFDPVDTNGIGKAAFEQICSPTLVLFADGGQCNKNAEWKGFGPLAKGPLVLASVVGASHCDGENAPRGLCAAPVFGCGAAAAPARQAVHARYATAHLLARLKNDPAAAATLVATALGADGEIASTSASAGAPCAVSPVDAGPDASPPVDGGIAPRDAGAPSGDGGSTASTPSPATADPATTSADDGCGCRVAAPTTVAPGLLAGFAALVLVARRRRAPSSR